MTFISLCPDILYLDHIGADCVEIELGMLVRRKKEKGYEWLIEI